jgi:hypothetical protein
MALKITPSNCDICTLKNSFKAMKNFLLLLLLLLCINVSAQESQTTATIIASGSGNTIENARNSALRSAIEQAYGVYISSKTEVLNDQVISDEIVAVTSGNITTYKILNESSSEDIHYSLLEATVSISKLTSFAQSKGFEVEFKGGVFTANLKQQQLNEKAEINAVRNSLSVALDLLKKGFDFTLSTKEPVLYDQLNKIWNIETTVISSTNENYELAIEIARSVLNDISLTKEEVEQYTTLGKPVYELKFYDMEFPDPIIYHLRTSDGLWAFIRFAYSIPAMSHGFELVDGIKYTKTGLQSVVNEESIVTLHDEIIKTIYQYFSSSQNYVEDFEASNPGYMNEIFASIIYCKRSNRDYLKKYDRILNDKHNIYPNDPYYFHLPNITVTKFDFHNCFLFGYIQTISTNKFNLRYTEQELGNLTSINCAPLPIDITTLNNDLCPYIDVTLRFDKDRLGSRSALDSQSQIQFTLNATYDEVKTFGRKESPYCYGYDSNSKTFKGFIYPFDRYDYGTWNVTTLTRTLEVNSLDLRKTSLALKKGLYSVPLEYFINVDGSLTLYSIGKIEFIPKGQLIQHLQIDCDLSHLDRNLVYGNIESKKKYLDDNEAQIKISSWITDSISNIHNYPVPVVGNEGGLQLKARHLGRDVFIFYID